MNLSARLRFATSTFAALCIPSAAFAGTSPNTGSLGSAADGTDAPTVTSGPGVVTAGGTDKAAVYNNTGGTNTTVPYQSALNPVNTAPFTIEFWASPTASDNDDAPVSNRVASITNRSGWVFFQRAAATGWNFRMYNGVTSGLGWDLTGGTSNLNSYSHVVATWDGSAAQLFVNGVLADNTNDPAATGVYNSNAAGATLYVGSSDTGSPFNGSVDEVAFYPTALSPAKILSHFNTASSSTPDAYFNLVRSDGALLQLSNNVPEPAAASLLMLGAGVAALRRRRR